MKDWLIIFCFLLILFLSFIGGDEFRSFFKKASDFDESGNPPSATLMERYCILGDIAVGIGDAALFSVLLYLSLMAMKLLSDKQLKTKYFLINLFVILLFPFCNALLHILIQYTREYFGIY